MKIKVLPVAELSQEHLSRWSALQQADPELASPYFCPEFTVAVASVRPDVYVAVLEDGGQCVGFFPFQRGRFGIGKPVGGLLSDYQGIIAAKDLHWDVQGLLRSCGLSSWTFGHLIASQKPFERYHATTAECHFVDLSQGFKGYAEALRKAGSHVLKDVRSKIRKLGREFGTVRFVPHVTEPDVLRTLIRWKSAQYRQSGLIDVFGFDWTVKLLQRIHSTQEENFAGMLSALYVNDTLVAAHMGMRSKTAWNWWFPRHDREFDRFSPGILLRVSVAETAPGMGVKRIDLGLGGETTYKPRLASGSVMLAQGRVEVPSVVNAAQRMYGNAEAWIRGARFAVVARAPGRLIKRAERRLRFR